MSLCRFVTYNALHPKYAKNNMTQEQMKSERGEARVTEQARCVAAMATEDRAIVCLQEASGELAGAIREASAGTVEVAMEEGQQVAVAYDKSEYTTESTHFQPLQEWFEAGAGWAKEDANEAVREAYGRLAKRAAKGKDVFVRAVLISGSGKRIHVGTAHLPVLLLAGGAPDDLAQTLALCALQRAWYDACRLEPDSDVHVLCGDMNIRSDSKAYAAVIARDDPDGGALGHIVERSVGGTERLVSVVASVLGAEVVTTRARRIDRETGDESDEPPFVATLDYVFMWRSDSERLKEAKVAHERDPKDSEGEKWPALDRETRSDHCWVRVDVRV